MWGPARDGPPEAGGYVGVLVGADAAQEDGPDDFDLLDRTDYGAPVVRAGPVPFFVEGADNVCPVWWQGDLPRDDVREAVGEDAEEVGGEVVVCFRREAVIAWGLCCRRLWMAFRTSWMVKGRFSSCHLWAWLKT